ncbi:MAG: B12-binding domain-containing radical SAM protein [Limisphaerales bacterium]
MSYWKTFKPKNRRRVLLVFPRYAKSFGTFDHAFALAGVRAFMPPQGLLLIAALQPPGWEVKFIDENVRPVRPEEWQWADVVFLSGMHVQRAQINDLNLRAHRAGKLTVLGGPSVSAAPEFYPAVDVLHCGEAGDSTWKLFEHLDQTVERGPKQLVFQTGERLPLNEFPSPAYQLLKARHYLLGSIQFSSGCPFTCEFCDIPGLYGRKPRIKATEQVIGELDQLADAGLPAVYFVDDNFIANPNAALQLLPHLVEWQERRGHPLRLSCEATLNISLYPQILELMRQAGFVTIFCGTETPEPAALRAMKKTQNLRRPILESVQTLNRYGLEVASGIILGLDTDTPETAGAIIDFAQESQIPLMTVNLLYALPKTPLYERLKRDGRLVGDLNGESNIVYLEPKEKVLERWRHVIKDLYEPANVYARFLTQTRQTYTNRPAPKNAFQQLTWRNLRRAARISTRIIWHVGLRSDYRRHFWKMFWTLIRRGEVEAIFHISIVAHHLISYTRQALQGKGQASNYSLQTVEE